jgi:hypothetical protein
MIIILLLITTVLSYSQNTYFVSKDGTGNFTTINQVNSASLNSGDIVSFKSGQQFADAVLICKAGVHYTSFGSGQAIIGDRTSNSGIDPTIQIDAEGVTLSNLIIYGYRDGKSGITYSKGNFTIKDCEIAGGQNAHLYYSTAIRQTDDVIGVCSNISIQRNKIHDWETGISFARPYNVDVGYNEIYNLWRKGAVMDGGGKGFKCNNQPDGITPADTWDANYTFRIHHNNIHHFEYVALSGGASRMIVEYNEIHHSLDERIYRGGVKHGSIGKMWDNTDFTIGNLGLVFRYNYVHDLVRRGEINKTYGIPNDNDYTTGVYTGQITSNEYKNAVYLYASSPYLPSYGDHFGDQLGPNGEFHGEKPDQVISGMGYGNFWIHNNIFYNCSNAINGRSSNLVGGSGDKMPWSNSLRSYFVNNTVINCGWRNYITEDNGLLTTEWDSQSPYVVINNIFDYTLSSARQLFLSKEDEVDLDYNIYLNQSGTTTVSPSPGDKKATYFRNTSASAGAHEKYSGVVSAATIWNDTSTTIFINSIGAAGAYISDCRLVVGGDANGTGKAFSTIGDTYTITGTNWAAYGRPSSVHVLGQDPTGRSFAYDILGNYRTTNDIGALGVVIDESKAHDTGLRILLEGSYRDGKMRTDLKHSDLLPIYQPYNMSPWNINGDVSVGTIPENCVDWILVQLRNDLTNTVNSKVALLTNDGTVLNTEGCSFTYWSIPSGEYYIVIKHRNHLSIMSAQKVKIEQGESVNYDFTDSQSKAYGENSMASVGDGKYAMIAGDGDANGVVNILDYSTVANSILSIGYALGDIDMNGVMNVLDYSFIGRNLLKKANLP